MCGAPNGLEALDGKPSRLNPLFYAASFALGAGAALASDKISLGFVHATEENVEAHLDDHLERIPESAQASRAVIEQMKKDEIEHGQAALDQGGEILPAPLRKGMKAVAKLMTQALIEFSSGGETRPVTSQSYG